MFLKWNLIKLIQRRTERPEHRGVFSPYDEASIFRPAEASVIKRFCHQPPLGRPQLLTGKPGWKFSLCDVVRNDCSLTPAKRRRQKERDERRKVSKTAFNYVINAKLS